MSFVWTSAAIGSVMITLIVVLICRERSLQRQLAEQRALIASLSERQTLRQDGDAERFKRSQYFARIGTWDWEIATDRVHDTIQQLIQDVADGSLKVLIDKTFPLKDAAEAHRYIESRQAVGRVLLIP